MNRINRYKTWLRWLIIAAATSALPALAQTAACTPSNSAFDAAYLASQPPLVAALIKAADGSTSQQAALGTQATALAAQGYIIDGPIDVWHWDPCFVMSLRASEGYTWLPNAFQTQIVLTPTANGPVATIAGTPYAPTATPPAGAILVSTNAASYPPYTTASVPSHPICAPPGPPSNGCIDPVGPFNFGTTFYTVTGDNSSNGTVFKDSRGSFTKTVIATPFGNESYWSLTGTAGN